MAFADAAATSTVVTLIVTLLVGLFGGGSLVALLRVSADKGKVVIEAAQGAVIVQTSVIDDLQDELNRVKKELADLRVQEARLWAENAALRARMALIERGEA